MMRENEGSIFEIEENVFSIIFNSFADRFKGTGSCNTFEGIFKTDTKTLFEVDDIVSGFKHCGTEKIEQLFLSRLKECDRFEIKEGKLQLSKQWQILLWFEIENNTKPTLTTTNFTKNESELENSNLKESSSNSESTSSHLYENSKVEEMQKEIEELKKLIVAQQKSEEEKSSLLAKQKQEVENEIVQKQLAEKQKQDEIKKIAAAEAAKAEEISKQKLQKQLEIEALKKQLAEKEAENKPLKSENNSVETIDNSTTDTENGDKKKNIGDYIITQFSKNTSKIIPDPEFPLRPYFIDGDELKKLERAEANFAIKQKGIYRGQDKQVQIMKEESPIQFIKGNLPRFFVSIEDDDVDPYDVIDLCRADRIGKGRRNFTYAGTKYGGRVKDVTGKLVQLDFKKIRNGLYEIIVDSDLEQGEYAFLPLFSNTQSLTSTNSIKANCFGIVDPEK